MSKRRDVHDPEECEPLSPEQAIAAMPAAARRIRAYRRKLAKRLERAKG